MPLYAYIKIPGINGSESTDSYYGRDWIPLTSVSLTSETLGEDSDYKTASKRRGKHKQLLRLKALLEKAKNDKLKVAEKVGKLSEKFESQSNPTDWEKIDWTLFKDDTEKSKSPDTEMGMDALDAHYATRKSGSSITISKMLDATSPKLQLKCLQCQQYASNEYIKAPLELHICRHTSEASKDDSMMEAYVAYILQNCIIKSVELDASENSKFEETITISFEKITSCIKLNKGKWDSKGWDFITEKSIDSPLDPRLPIKLF